MEHTPHMFTTDLYFTYMCKLSCILNNGNNEHANTIECTTIRSLLCSKYQSSVVEAWYPISTELHCLDCFYLATTKFDHRSSVRTLDLILKKEVIHSCFSSWSWLYELHLYLQLWLLFGEIFFVYIWQLWVIYLQFLLLFVMREY